jgi:hypothetical protein
MLIGLANGGGKVEIVVRTRETSNIDIAASKRH